MGLGPSKPLPRLGLASRLPVHPVLFPPAGRGQPAAWGPPAPSLMAEPGNASCLLSHQLTRVVLSFLAKAKAASSTQPSWGSREFAEWGPLAAQPCDMGPQELLLLLELRAQGLGV